MSFLYPRTITIYREAATSGAGVRGYGGATRGTESTVASGLAANIICTREGRSNGTQLPDDTFASIWMINFRKVADGVVHNRDVITDDLGRRFKIVAATPTPLGYQCMCDLLEA